MSSMLGGKSFLLPFVTLVFLNLLAHFLPFERASRSLDDLAVFSAVKNMSVQSFLEWTLREMVFDPNRPFLGPSHYLVEIIVGESKILAVTTVFLTSSFLTLAIYVLMVQLVNNAVLALICVGFYLLLPTKLDLYYTLDYSVHNIVHTIYVVSFIFFILFIKENRKLFLSLSMLSYTIAIFWYQLGFFLPLVLVCYAFFYDRRKVFSAVLFGLPVMMYFGWRHSCFGCAESGAQVARIQLESIFSNVVQMWPNNYVGRYVAKTIVYGIYRFPTIELPWIVVVVIGDVICVAAFIKWLRMTSVPEINAKVIYLSAVMFVAFSLPALLTWGILGRHTALASIGFAIFVIATVSLTKVHRVKILASMVGIGLIVSQGTAWSQVVAGRMNNAIFETLVTDKDEILRSDRVLIDQHSFAERIPYTWVNDRHNQVDTYWGVAGLLGRGFPFLVHLAVGEKKPTYVVRSRIEAVNEELRFKVYDPNAYALREKGVPKNGTVIVDYTRVYGESCSIRQRFSGRRRCA